MTVFTSTTDRVPWPWPADTPLDRSRRVARMYRDMLAKQDPELCAQLDDRAAALGQGWVRPQLAEIDMDDLLDAQEVADFCFVEVRTVAQWRARGLHATPTSDGLRYRVGDVLDYHANLRKARIARSGGPQPGMFPAPSTT